MRFEQGQEDFTRFAEDLYPGRYSRDYVKLLVEMSEAVQSLARRKSSTIVAHNYQYPELQEVADTAGDSLGLSQYAASRKAARVDFSGCLSKTLGGAGPYQRAYFLSTEQMLWRAKSSPRGECIVGTENGMLYRLRKAVPQKTFHPVSASAVCEYMKMNTNGKASRFPAQRPGGNQGGPRNS